MASADRSSDDETGATLTADARGVAGTQLAAGAKVGRYEVDRQLGAGGMGIVYLAHDPALDRPVALKLVRPGLDTARARLLREGQVIARLSHPNVVTVHDVGPHGDELFIAMEYVEGSTLGDWLDQRRPWREVLEVFRAAGRGLDAAHAAGLVHRDFKPDNVLLGPGGRVVVTDFGLARREDSDDAEPAAPAAAAADSRLTRTGSFLGTPAYMAPEQIRGDAVDARSDQFGFCVALWEGLHGTRPFRRADTTREELLASIDAGIVAPAGSADVPGWIDRALRRGLSTDPAARWPSMAALLDGLTPRSSRPLMLGIAALGAVAVVAAVGISSLGGGARRPAPAPSPAIACDDDAAAALWTSSAREAYTARASARAAGQDVPWFDRYAADWQQARSSLCKASLAPAAAARRRTCLDDALTAFRAAIERPETQWWPALPLLDRCASDQTPTAPVLSPVAGRLGQYDMYSLSPDGQRAAVAIEGKVYLQAVGGGDEQLVPAAAGALAVSILPDERRLLVVNGDTSVDVLDPATGERRQVAPWARAGDVSRDGRWLAYAGDHDVLVRPLDGDDPPRKVATAAIAVLAVGWSPDGRWLAILKYDDVDVTHVEILDPLNGEVAASVPFRVRAEQYWMSWLPDGRIALNGAHDRLHAEGVWLLRVDDDGHVPEAPELRIAAPERTLYGILGSGGDRVLLSRTDIGGLLVRHDRGAAASSALPGRIGDWMPCGIDDRGGRLLVWREHQVAWLTLDDQSITQVTMPGLIGTPTVRDGRAIWIAEAGAGGSELVELGDDGVARAVGPVALTDLTESPNLACAPGAIRRCAIIGARNDGGALIVVDGHTVGPARAVDARAWATVAMSPDGRSLAVADRIHEEVRIVDLETLVARPWPVPKGCRVLRVHWARATVGVIAYLTCEGDDRLVRVSEGAPVELSRFREEIRASVVTADDTIYASLLRFDMTMLIATGL